jgi:hypothetical protein
MKQLIALTCFGLGALSVVSPEARAQSVVDGAYYSAAGANGRGACKLVISTLPQDSKYGDKYFSLESSGEGACEWSAIGLSKNYAITAGVVTNGGVPAFMLLKFPFGPAGKRVELTSFNADGSPRNIETFSRGEEQASVTAE